MARDDPHFRLRIPDQLKKQIENAAVQNGRSINAEIILRLESSLLGNLNSSSLDELSRAFANRMILAKYPLSERDRDRFNEVYTEAKDAETKAMKRFITVSSELLEKMENGRNNSRENENDT